MAIMEAEQTASFVRNFNPLLETGAARWPTFRAMYEPMLIHNRITGQWVPWLAEGFAYDESRTRIRFPLRRGVRWSDGEAFSARDVVQTFALLRKHAALDGRGLWERLTSVEAIDDHTVDVVLRQPHAPAFEEIAQQAIVPAHIWTKLPDPTRFANERPVATGPFTEVNFFGAQAYEIGRNPHHWQPARGLSALRFRAYPANEPATLALLHDEVDWAGMFVPAIDRVFVGRDPAHHHNWGPLLDAMVFLYVNSRKPPWDDVRARKALSMAIDRARVTGIAMQGNTRPADATGLSDAYAHFRDPAQVAAGAAWVTHDEAAAAHAFDALGLRIGVDGVRRRADGTPLAVNIDVPAGFSDWIAACQIMARGFRRIGIDVTVRASEYQTWFERLSTGGFELSMAWSDLNTVPFGTYRSLMSTATVKPLGEVAAENWHRVGIPAADPIFEALQSAVDTHEQKRLYSQLQALFVAHAPALPLFSGPLWGQYNSRRFQGFPSATDPYAPLSPNVYGPQPLLVLTRLSPR
jgi:peptide/nickel transport system substrate-binding protein